MPMFMKKKQMNSKDKNMILDALELLSWVIRTKELFGLSNNYEYREDEVNRLYQSLEND